MDANWRIFMTKSEQNRELIEAEVWYGNEQWARVSEQDNVIHFFNRREQSRWMFQLEDVQSILKTVMLGSLNGGK